MKINYRYEFADNPRASESSERVVYRWYDNRVLYIADDWTGDICFQRIVAERVLIRHLLNIGELENKQRPYVADICPFGDNGPALAELLLPNVFVAMALLPLTPLRGGGKPCIARLYCVSGLAKRYFPIELPESDRVCGNGLSWFLTGLEAGCIGKPIEGRSWLLAAELLKRVVAKQDRLIVQNLMTHFIITGDVSGDKVVRVEMGRKGDLAMKTAFKNFKWIIPKENNMDIPKRKIEKPATVEEAYELIKSMQSYATRAMFKFVRHSDMEEARTQYEKNGADLFAFEEATGMSILEVVSDQLKLNAADQNLSEGERSSRGLRLEAIMEWLKQKGCDCARMYYLISQIADKATMDALTQIYPINAVDENGLTAADWALNAEDWPLLERICECGGRCNSRVGANRKLWKVLSQYGVNTLLPAENFYKNGREFEYDREFVIHALDAGISPSHMVIAKATYPRNPKDIHNEEWVEDGFMEASIFRLALSHCDVEVVKACLRNGADMQTSILRTLKDSKGGHVQWSGFGSTAITLLEKEMEERLSDYLEEEYNWVSAQYKEVISILEANGFAREREWPSRI